MTHDDLLYAVIALVIPASIAAFAAIRSARIAAKNRRSMDTGNDRPIGETIHDIAQQQEIAAAIQHTNTRELVQVVEHVVKVEDKLDGHIEDAQRVHDAILSRLDAVILTQDTEGGTK